MYHVSRNDYVTENNGVLHIREMSQMSHRTTQKYDIRDVR